MDLCSAVFTRIHYVHTWEQLFIIIITIFLMCVSYFFRITVELTKVQLQLTLLTI